MQAPDGDTTRPTTDRNREALFHILTSRWFPSFQQTRVLDLFAGSGALGIEALSRGASHATFAEADTGALRALQQNLSALGLTGRAQVLQGTLPNTLTRHPSSGHYRLIFADPPYALDPLPTVRAAAQFADLGAILCLEHASSARPTPGLPWRLIQRRAWGNTTVSIFQKVDPASL